MAGTRVNLGPKGTIALCIILGIIFIAVGYFLLSESIRISKDGITTEAEVVKVNIRHSGKSVYYTPVIKFTTDEGEVIETELDSASLRLHEGDTVEIVYSEDNPQEVMNKSLFNRYGFPGIFLLSGAFVFVLGVLKIIKKQY